MNRAERERKEYRNSLKEILLNDKKVTWYTLDECVNLESVVIGEQVETIETGAFFKCCKLKRFEIRNNDRFRAEGDCLIEKESNTLVLCCGTPHIPQGIDTVHMECFTATGRVPVFSIHENVKKLVADTLHFSIGRLELDSGNRVYELENGCLFEKGGNTIVLGCEESAIPARAKRIGRCAFAGCGFAAFSVPSYVETVGDSAFYGCSALASIELKEGIREIGEAAFDGCTALLSIRLPDSVIKLGKIAFWNCRALHTIESFGSIEKIERDCFHGSGLKRLTVPGSIKTIGDSAFACSALEELNIEDGVQEIGSDAFCDCEALKKAFLADSVIRLGDGTFACCTALTEVRLSAVLKVVPMKCFYECKTLPEIEFPEGLERIETWAFYNCSQLETTNMGELKKLKKVIKDAFSGCRKLKDKGPAAKKPQPFPQSFYSFDSFDEIINTLKPGDTLSLMKPSLSEWSAQFRAGAAVEGRHFLRLAKKENEQVAEIADAFDEELKEFYEVYLCSVINKDDPAYDAAWAALQQTK